MPIDMSENENVASTRAGAAAAAIRRMILTGEFAPGEKLRQVELAARLGISTTPLREAFRTLARERLVVHDAQRGVVVFSPSRRDILENYEMRIALEPLATQLAAERIEQGALDELERILVAMRKEPSPAAYQALNRSFHRTIYGQADRPQLLETIEVLRDAFEAYVLLDATSGFNQRYRRAVHDQHEAIAVALAARTPRWARTLMERHLQDNVNHYLASLDARDHDAEQRGPDARPDNATGPPKNGGV